MVLQALHETGPRIGFAVIITGDVFLPQGSMPGLILLAVSQHPLDGGIFSPKIPNQFHIGFQLGLGQIFPTLHPSHILDADGAPVQPDGMAVQGRFRGQLPDGPGPPDNGKPRSGCRSGDEDSPQGKSTGTPHPVNWTPSNGPPWPVFPGKDSSMHRFSGRTVRLRRMSSETGFRGSRPGPVPPQAKGPARPVFSCSCASPPYRPLYSTLLISSSQSKKQGTLLLQHPLAKHVRYGSMEPISISSIFPFSISKIRPTPGRPSAL